MAKGLINRYVWLIDTIQRYGRITREDLNNLWVKSSLSDGEPIPRRTFYNYRQGVEETFNVIISCDPATFEYYIEDSGDEQDENLRNWLLDSASISGMLSDSKDVAGRILLEDVPSAREHLPVIMQALKGHNRIEFSYKAFTRVNAVEAIIAPYFVRIFKQRWYVIGQNLADSKIKTYSLDRINEVHILHETFTMPSDFDAKAFFNDCFGIITSKGEAKDVTLKVSSNQAKYFRALPLHHSQQEEVHDAYSLFYYHLYITYDFVQEILSHGVNVQVLSPPELRAMIVTELENALSNYK
ncbi:MAG: WYL domain-containing protein [Muribaculaceae bacterium]